MRGYNELVTKYKAKPSSAALKVLQEKCAELVKVDDQWIETLQQQLRAGQETLAFATETEAADLVWSEATAATNSELTSAVVAAQQTRVADQRACPREHY
jgi:hypothetical protein